MGESTVFGISARALLAIIIVVACCSVAIFLKDILVLKDLAFLVLGFYFGQKPTINGGSNVQSNSQVLQQPIQQDTGKPTGSGV